MNKEAIRSMIFLKWKEQLSGKEIHESLCNSLRDNAPSYATVKNWIWKFRRGETDFKDKERSGRPKFACSEENVSLAEGLVKNDTKITVRQLGRKLGISKGSAHNILADELGLIKKKAVIVPHHLTSEQMKIRLNASIENLALIKADKELFFDKLVTMDETWVLHYNLTSKLHDRDWLKPGQKPSKRPKLTQTTKKVQLSIWWDKQGLLLIEPFKKNSESRLSKYTFADCIASSSSIKLLP